MAFPAGVATATCTAGSDLTFTGDDVGLTAELAVIIGGEATHIVWEATGQPFDAFVGRLSAEPGVALTFELPLVDQAGFINSNGDDVTFWAYQLTVLPRVGLDTAPRVKVFQLVAGDVTVDIDLIPDGSVTPPVSAPNLPLTIPRLVEQLEDPASDTVAAVDAATADLIPDVATAVGAAVAALIAAAVVDKQAAAVMLTKLTALAETMTEGQLIKWDATLGEPVAVNPTGSSVNASAVNATGTSTACSAGGAVIPLTAISVTDSGGRPVVLEWEGTFAQTVAGVGTVWLALYETTAGANTHRKSNIKTLPNTTSANGSQVDTGISRLPIGVVTTTRTFELRAIILTVSGTPGASFWNGVTTPTLLQAINQ